MRRTNIREDRPLALQARPTTMFHPSEVEMRELMTHLKDRIKQVGPARIVIDSLAELRLLAEETLRYRPRNHDPRTKVRSGRYSGR